MDLRIGTSSESINMNTGEATNVTVNKDYRNLTNKPVINGVTLEGEKSLNDLGVPEKLSDLTEDASHRSVTDTEKEDWNKKADISDIPISDVDANTAARHTHSNKATLDAVTAEKASGWDEAYGQRHTHSNKSVLDGITSALVTAWNAASTWVSTNGSNVVSHLSDTVKHITAAERTAWNNKAESSDIPTALSDLDEDKNHRTVTEAEMSYWNNKANKSDIPTTDITANTNARHTHSNKSVLDGITSALVTAWNTASTWVSTNGSNVVSHLSDTVKHITAAERTAWNAKADTDDIPTKVSELENDSEYHSDTPIAEKFYENVWNTHSAGTSSSSQYSYFIFGKYTPIDLSKETVLRFRVEAKMPRWTDDNLTANGLAPASYGGVGSGANWGYGLHVAEVEIHCMPCLATWGAWYRINCGQASTTYRSLYYVTLGYPKTKTQDDQSQYFGVSINGYQYYGPTETAAALRACFGRDITFKVLQADNCTVEFFDEKIEYLSSNFPNHTLTTLSMATNGDTHSGDVNQVDRNTSPFYKSLATPLIGYALLFNTSDGKVAQFSTATASTTAQTKAFADVEMDIWQGIYYYGSGTTRAAGYAMGGAGLYNNMNSIDLRYSTNCGNNFLVNAIGHDIYLMLQKQTDGYFKVHPVARTISGKTYNIEVVDDTMLPAEEDGIYYLLLGHTSGPNRYSINFPMKHPVYKYSTASGCMEYVGTC